MEYHSVRKKECVSSNNGIRERKKRTSKSWIKRAENLRAQSQLEAGVDGAAVGGMVVVRLQVGLGTAGVTGVAVDGRTVLASLAGGDGKAVLGECGRGTVHVDA